MNQLATSRWAVQQLVDTAPSGWKVAFRAKGLPERPTVDQIVEKMLEQTAGGEPAGPRGGTGLAPPSDVRAAAFRGLQLSHDNDYTGWNGIGLARAVQLTTQPKVWPRSIERMYGFFHRNRRYMDYDTFGDDRAASNSWMAWLNWGGTPGYVWSGQVLGEPVDLG